MLRLSAVSTAVFSVIFLSFSVSAGDKPVEKNKKPADNKDASAAKPDKEGWVSLFNGKNIDGWKVTNFGGEGKVHVKDGCVVIEPGVDLSGITATRKDLAGFKSNYEIQFEAQRSQGSDFFVGLTFPYKESHISLICGGWGGSLCGLSSLSGLDASENETMSVQSFTNGLWYQVRIRVTDDKIEAWLRDAAKKGKPWTEEDNLVDVETADHRIDVRFEVDLSKPMGFATYQSTAKIRHARIRRLPQAKSQSAKKATK